MIVDCINPIEKEKFITAELSYPNCDLFAASDETRSVYIWKAGYSTPILTFMGHSSPVNTILLNSEEAELYSGLKGGMIVLWDIFNQKVKINLQGHSTFISSMSIYRNNNTPCVLASGSADGKIKLWDLKTKSAATNFKGHFSQIDSLCFSPDFTYLASGAQDGIVKLWDIRLTNKTLKEFSDKDQKAINCIEFNNYEMAFAFGGKDKMIRYYNLEKFNKIGQTSADRLPIQKISFDNEGNNIFSATDESLKYWEINEQGLSLVDMFETGWNKLQSFKYIEGKAVCALSTFGNKISYYLLKYKELFKSPNMHLRENPKMGNIFEVHESDDSTFLDNISFTKKLDNKNGLGDKKIDLNNADEKNKNNTNDKNTRKANSSKNVNSEMNSLGISKFINNNDMTNVSISLTDISTSKIENESQFFKNAMNLIGKSNYNDPIAQNNNKKIINPDDIPLPKPNNTEKEKSKNINDEQADKIMIGDISNMSDISDNNNETKNDITLGTIFGNKNNNEIINTTINKATNNPINRNPINKNDNEEFKEFGEKEMDEFFGKSIQNKNLDISAIQSSTTENDAGFFDFPMSTATKNLVQPSPLTNKNSNTNSNQNLKEEPNTNLIKDKKMTLDELSPSNVSSNNNNTFLSLKSNETLGIDFTQFIEENGMLNETKQIIPQSKDLPILQEINSKHDTMRRLISKRFNGLKIVAEKWKNSDIPSTLNALQILKDYSVVKDFFDYAIISREDINLISLTLDNGVSLLPYVLILMKSKIDVYWKTACRAGMTFLKIFTEKIESTKVNKKKSSLMEVDQILEERDKKCNELINIFKQIYESSYLKKHIKQGGTENNNLAYAFFSDLQFFLKSFDDNNNIIVNNI